MKLALRLSVLAAAAGAALGLGTAAQAHPLGNFTTNTATRVVVRPDRIDVHYAVDLAEIPALRFRQTEGVPAGTTELGEVATRACSQLRDGLRLTVDGRPSPLRSGTSSGRLVDGQAGLPTVRLDCTMRAAAMRTGASVTIADGNHVDRFGWREVSVAGDRMRVRSDAPATSPSDLLRRYPDAAATDPMMVRSASFTASAGGPPLVERPTTEDGPVTRSTDSMTARFQSLVTDARHGAWFVAGAIAIAAVLGGLHALAPGTGRR